MKWLTIISLWVWHSVNHWFHAQKLKKKKSECTDKIIPTKYTKHPHFASIMMYSYDCLQKIMSVTCRQPHEINMYLHSSRPAYMLCWRKMLSFHMSWYHYTPRLFSLPCRFSLTFWPSLPRPERALHSSLLMIQPQNFTQNHRQIVDEKGESRLLQAL